MIEKRHAKSVADRLVEYTRDRDGMAWISAYLPADSASAIWNKTTAIARGLQGPNETRPLTQIKADEFARRLLTHTATTSTASGGNTTGTQRSSNQPGTGTGTEQQAVIGDQIPDAFIGLATLTGSDEPAADLGVPDGTITVGSNDNSSTGEQGTQGNDTTENAAGTASASPEAGKTPTPRADVLVTVPVFSLLGLSDEPAVLDGYGPIPASMARKLLRDRASSFYRVLVDPRDGAPLEIGRTSYRVTKAMKQALRLRDGKCTFPGCNNSTLDNDTGHLQARQHGGSTSISNLAQLCPKHHRLKHNSGWTSTQATENQPPGYTSPTGRHYPSEQPDWEPSIWPDTLPNQELNTEPHPLEPPDEEPEDDNLIDADDIAPYDPMWDDFYAMPVVLPPDPQKDMPLENWDLGNCVPILT